MLRVSVTRTLGLIFVIVGLILTIYGHLAKCIDCKGKEQPQQQNVGTIEYNSKIMNSYNSSPSSSSSSEMQQHNDWPKYGESTVKYCKLIGPTSFVIGIFIIFISFVMEKRSRRVSTETSKKRPHWSEEIAMQVLAEQRKKLEDAKADIYSPSTTLGATTSVNTESDDGCTFIRGYWTNITNRPEVSYLSTNATNIGVSSRHKTTVIESCSTNTRDDVRYISYLFLNDSTIIQPPPTYEETTIEKIAEKEVGNQDTTEIRFEEDQPPTYEECTITTAAVH